MITVGDVYQALDAFAPFSTQEKWDNSGLLVGSAQMPAERIYVTLDLSAETIAAARAQQAQLMVAHHPVIFQPFSRLTPADPVWQLASNGIAAICSHTPLDQAPAGINGRQHAVLAPVLELEQHSEILAESRPGLGFGWMDVSKRGRHRNWQQFCGRFWAVPLCGIVRQIAPFRKLPFAAVLRQVNWNWQQRRAAMP